MQFSKLVLGTAVATLLSTASALAIPTATVDGITIPIDSSAGGAVFTDQVDHESLITGVGDQLYGYGVVSQIQDFPTSTTTYLQPCATTGCAGTFLTDVFSGLTVRAINSVTGGFEVYLTGGSLNYYVHSTLPNLTTGDQTTDMTNAAAGTLFLSLQPTVFDSFGDTMSIFVPGTSLGNFTGVAQGQAFLDVTGGDAATNFDTNTFAVGNGTTADLEFVGNANRSTTGDFPVGGSDNTFANTVPEPATLALLGAGLFLMAWSLRRKSSSASQV